MASRREIAEQLAKELPDLMLPSDHMCRHGAAEGEERLIIHYVAGCELCLTQLLDYILRRNTPLA